MPKSSYQLGPIDAKEKATVEKILDIDIPRLQSEKGRSAMRWLVPWIRNKIGSTTGRAGCWNQMKSIFIGHVIYMQPKSRTFKNLPATSSGTVLSPKLLWNLPWFPRVFPNLLQNPARNLPPLDWLRPIIWIGFSCFWKKNPSKSTIQPREKVLNFKVSSLPADKGARTWPCEISFCTKAEATEHALVSENRQ